MCAQFVPTTPILDITQLKGKNLDSPEFKEFMIRLTQYLNIIALAVNEKVSGEYSTIETDNGKQFWPLIPGEDPRASKSIVVVFGALPNGPVNPTKSVNHGINFTAGTNIWTNFFGIATNPATGTGIPLPYSSATLANNIEAFVTATQVTVTTSATVDWSAYTNTYFYLEWL